MLQASTRDSKIIKGYVSWLEEFAGEVLGILPPSNEALELHQNKISRMSEIKSEVDNLLKMRNVARESKDWSKSDRIREELHDMGVVVEDSPDGTKWRIL